jgi:hypothetical protein
MESNELNVYFLKEKIHGRTGYVLGLWTTFTKVKRLMVNEDNCHSSRSLGQSSVTTEVLKATKAAFFPPLNQPKNQVHIQSRIKLPIFPSTFFFFTLRWWAQTRVPSALLGQSTTLYSTGKRSQEKWSAPLVWTSKLSQIFSRVYILDT